MINFIPSPMVKDKLDKANKYWEIFVNTLIKAEKEPRITAILYQLIIEHYVNEILILKSQMKSYRDSLRYDQKLELLTNAKLFTEEEIQDLEKIYKIRNMYAHEIDISIQFIESCVSPLKSANYVSPEDTQTKYFILSNIMMKKIQRTFMELLEKEQEKFDEQ